MPASKERAEAIAARLSAVGLATRVEERDDCTAIEAEVPEPQAQHIGVTTADDALPVLLGDLD
ncbi:hypothetical protein AB0O04_37020, partial [Streptomyces althioticus]